MSARPTGRTLELYFIDGTPDGMLTAQVFNWTGRVLAFPRTQLSEALARRDIAQAGVYFLWGEDVAGEELAYVGESENVRERFRQHDAAKPWWTRAVIVTAAGESLNKAHVRYLEARLIDRVRGIGRVRLENGTTPPWPPLSEAERANMDVFLDNLLLVLPTLRLDFLVQHKREPISASVTSIDASGPITFELSTPKHGVHGQARLAEGEFIVEAGSVARAQWAGGPHQTYAALFDELVRTGVLVAEHGMRRFSVDYAFRSPSAAAAVLNGRSTNGAEEWREVATGKTYGQWERDRLHVSGARTAPSGSRPA